MTKTTYTCTTYNQIPPFHHTGSSRQYGQVVLGPATGNVSVSDIVFLCIIPNRARIVDLWIRGSSAETAAVFKLGIAGGTTGTETTFGTLTLSTGGSLVMRPLTGVPFAVSRSDTDAQSGATIYMTISSGTWTTTATLEFMVEYQHPGLVGGP